MSDRPVCLTIGGSDSCGGAGIQADLRVFSELGVHGCSAITALTAQNPQAITRIEAASLAQLDAELHAIFDHYDVAAVKTGMLVDADHVAVVAALLEQLHKGYLVVDPVIVSSSGKPLLNEGGIDALVHALLPQASLITPNLDEAGVLLGYPEASPEVVARALSDRLGCAVLLKGGHGEGSTLTDTLIEQDGTLFTYAHRRQSWTIQQSHGTGCRLASAIAAHLSKGQELPEAVSGAVAYLQNS